jgi:tRNA-specific 2-thiouridylase
VAAPKPYFVLHLDTSANNLVVGSRDEASAREVDITDVSMVSGEWPGDSFAADAVVRYRGTPHIADVTLGLRDERQARARFVSERGPIASPGQAIVFYKGDEVVGGGTISAVIRG